MTTPGSATANSYPSLSEANGYHDTRLNSSAWTDASAETKNVSLLMATRTLDAMFDWESYSTEQEQALRWPRTALWDYNRRDYVDNDEIPIQLKNAVSELARQLIVEDRTLDSDIETTRLRGLKAGPVSLQFGEGVRAKVIPDAVYNLIPSWWGTAVDRGPRVMQLERG